MDCDDPHAGVHHGQTLKDGAFSLAIPPPGTARRKMRAWGRGKNATNRKGQGTEQAHIVAVPKVYLHHVIAGLAIRCRP
jgi:hypothetical protein